MPDLTSVNEILARELASGLPPNHKVDELVHLAKLLREPFYKELRGALVAIDQPGLPHRFTQLSGWLAYLDSPAQYKLQLDEQEAEARRDEIARKRQEMEEKRLLASVPALGRKCLTSIAAWQRHDADIERFAVGGNPSAVRNATTQREAAAKSACEAAANLRVAINLYARDGIRDAATAIAREHDRCLRACASNR